MKLGEVWKNVRPILAMGILLFYCVYSGVEVYFAHKVPDGFMQLSSTVAGYYFITRAVEGRLNKTNQNQ